MCPLQLLLCLGFMLFSLSDAFVNLLDKPFDFNCPHNQFLSRVYSEHSNAAEDRRFDLDCKLFPVDTSDRNVSCIETKEVNDFDQPFQFSCPSNYMLTGMASRHDDFYEDRRYKFHCCSISDAVVGNSSGEGFVFTNPFVDQLTLDHHLIDCEYSGWVNSYDQPEDFTVPDGKVLRGVASIHDNTKEDRIFDFETCTLVLVETLVG